MNGESRVRLRLIREQGKVGERDSPHTARPAPECAPAPRPARAGPDRADPEPPEPRAHPALRKQQPSSEPPRKNLLFVNKKKQKNFIRLRPRASRPANDQTFFGSFFQKRTACFNPYPAPSRSPTPSQTPKPPWYTGALRHTSAPPS